MLIKRSVKQTVCVVSGWSGEGFNIARVSCFTKERSTIASPGIYVHVHMCDHYDRDAARSNFISCALICKVRLRTGFMTTTRHALNSEYALISEMCLITGKYGI